MKTRALVLILILLVSSCNKKDTTVSGSLYFKSIAFVNFYGVSKEGKSIFDNYLEELKANDAISEQEKEVTSCFQNLKRLNLESSPYIRIIDNNRNTKIVFMKETDYSNFKEYNAVDLIDNNQKVNVTLITETLDKDIYFLKEIVKIQVVQGETQWNK